LKPESSFSKKARFNSLSSSNNYRRFSQIVKSRHANLPAAAASGEGVFVGGNVSKDLV